MNKSFLLLLTFTIVGLSQELQHLPIPQPSTKTDFSWNKEYGKSTTKFTATEWQQVIDATWGQGISTTEKLEIFDFWFNEIHLTYAGFHNDNVDIFALRDRYRPEIEAGVTRGRFSGIMNHFTYQLNELHTYIFDVPVWATTKNKGIPLLTVGQWGLNRHFGALLTPLEDSTLVVYKAVANHPIGLEPGDVVLGYDGMAWKDIYPTLLEAELPIFYNSVNASTKEANDYYLLQAAGLNWHLFDTIDIMKYGSSDTLHYSTNLLAGQNTTLWGSEQVDVPGVTWPNRSNGDRVSWGVVAGTKVGYVYVTSWTFDLQFNIRAEFEQAVDSLMHHTETDGIIFDFRYNTGGGALAREGLTLLFNNTVQTVGFDRKVRGTDPFLMEPDPLRQWTNLIVRGNSTTFYDKPIAILIGPGSISAGELEALRMSFHPNARLFGKTAPGGNSGSDFIDIVGNDDWFASLSNSAMYRFNKNAHDYIIHIGLEPDTKVWFNRDDVANGTDTVVESAIAWINDEQTGITITDSEALPKNYQLKQNYPNPFNPTTTIQYSLPSASEVRLTIHAATGESVRLAVSEMQPAGKHAYIWDGRNDWGNHVASGIYFYQLSSGDFKQTRKMILLK